MKYVASHHLSRFLIAFLSYDNEYESIMKIIRHNLSKKFSLVLSGVLKPPENIENDRKIIHLEVVVATK